MYQIITSLFTCFFKFLLLLTNNVLHSNDRFIFDGARETQRTFAAVRENMRRMILHSIFLQGIRVCILLNTLSLSLEHHDQPVTLTKVYFGINIHLRNCTYFCRFWRLAMLFLAAFSQLKWFSNLWLLEFLNISMMDSMFLIA